MNENEQPVESAPAPEQEPVPVVLAELPRITFEWAVIAVRNILLATLFWAVIIAVIGFALFLVFGMIGKIAGVI